MVVLVELGEIELNSTFVDSVVRAYFTANNLVKNSAIFKILDRKAVTQIPILSDNFPDALKLELNSF